MYYIKDFIFKYSKYFLAGFPLLDIKTTNVVIAIFVVSVIWSGSKKQRFLKINSLEKVGHILLLSVPFIFFVISILWSENHLQGYSFIERSLLFLILPLVLFFFEPFTNRNEISLFKKVYIACTTILGFLILLYLLIQTAQLQTTFDISDYKSILWLRTEIDQVPFINEHPIYLTLIMGSSIIFLFFNRFKRSWVNYISFTLMLLVILVSSSKGPTIGLITVFITIIFLRVKTIVKKMAYLSSFLFLIIIAIAFSPLKSRVLEITNTTNLFPEGVHYNSFNLRMGIYKCDIEVMKTTPLYGYGSGSVQEKLDRCYEDFFKTNAFRERSYNTHNQFFFYWICFGFLGLLIIVTTYIVFLMKAYNGQQPAYFFFLIFFFISFLTENVLNRNTGIMLFTVFNSLFYYQSYLKDDYNKW